MMKIILIVVLSIMTYADFMCQMAGDDVARYSRAYDDAVDEYESAEEGEEKHEAKEEMEEAKSNLMRATDNVFTNCESNVIVTMGQLLQEKKQLEIRIAELLKENHRLTHKKNVSSK